MKYRLKKVSSAHKKNRREGSPGGNHKESGDPSPGYEKAKSSYFPNNVRTVLALIYE